MYAYALEELVRAAAPRRAPVRARERAEVARQTRPHIEDRPKIAPTVTQVTVFSASRC